MKRTDILYALITALVTSSMVMAGEFDLFGETPRPVAGSASSFDLFCSPTPIAQSDDASFTLFPADDQSTTPTESGERQRPAVTLHLPDGRVVDAHVYIAEHYTRAWTYPGDIDSHLQRHGLRLDEIRRLSVADRRNLHAAIHEEGIIDEPQAAQLAAQRTRQPRPAQAYQACPNGQCPQQWSGVAAQPANTRRRPLIRWIRQ